MNRIFLALLAPLTATTVGWLSSPAAALSLISSSGTWSNIIGVDSTLEFQTVGGENQVRWGVPVVPDGTIDSKSGLGFRGVGASSFGIGDIFAVGTLRHFNQMINLLPGTVATAADLTVNLAFSEPAIASAFSFTFSVNETLNNGPCLIGEPPCPDIIGFSNAFATESFTVDGTEYTLELLGFQTESGEILTQFVSPESGGANAATLFARVTTPPDPTAVPEPALGVGLCLIGLSFAARRRSAVAPSAQDLSPQPPQPLSR